MNWVIVDMSGSVMHLMQNHVKAAQRLGFTFEGVFRQATMYKGRNRDTAWYAIIDSDWPKVKQAFENWLDPENFDKSGQQKTKLQMTLDLDN